MKKRIGLSLALLSTFAYADKYDDIAIGLIDHYNVYKEVEIKEEIKDNNSVVGYIYHLRDGGYIVVSTNPNSQPVKAFSFDSSYSKGPAAFKNLVKSDLAQSYNYLGGSTGVIAATSDSVYVTATSSTSSTTNETIKINTDEVNKNKDIWKVLTEKSTNRTKQEFTAIPPQIENNPPIDDSVYCATSTDRNGVPIETSSFKEHLMTLEWNQSPLYNKFFPANSSDELALTGCVQTATSMVIAHNRHPSSGVGSAHYVGTIDNRGSYPMFADFTRELNFDNMPDKLTSSSSLAEVDEVANLMRDLGVAHGAGMGVSGGSNGGTSAGGVVPAFSLSNYYNYSTTINWLDNSDINAFKSEVQNQVDAGYPMLLTVPGHMTVLDGYDYGGAGDFIYINMGWGGYANGFYAPDSTISAGGYNFAPDLEIIYNIKPCSGGDCAPATDTTDNYDFDSQFIGGEIDWVADIDTYDIYLKGDTSFPWTYNSASTEPLFFMLYNPEGELIKVWDYEGTTLSNLPLGKYKLKISYHDMSSATRYPGAFDPNGANHYEFAITTESISPAEKAGLDESNNPPEITNATDEIDVRGPTDLTITTYDREGDSVTITATCSDTSKATVNVNGKVVEITPLQANSIVTIDVEARTSDGQTDSKTFTANILSLDAPEEGEEPEVESPFKYFGDLSVGSEITFKFTDTEFGGYDIAKYYFDNGNGDYVEVKPENSIWKYTYLVPGTKNVKLQVVNKKKAVQNHTMTLEISDLTAEQKAAYRQRAVFYCQENPTMCLSPDLVSVEDAVSSNGMSPTAQTIASALAAGDISSTQTLYPAFQATEFPAKNGITPIFTLIKKKDVTAVKALISGGANINAQDPKKGETPLHYAVGAKQYELVSALVAAGADTTIAEFKKGLTPIALAVSKSDILALQAFVDAGYNIDAKDADGKTMLHLAVEMKKLKKLLPFFLDNGADLNVSNNEGQTIAHLLVGLRDTKTMEALIPEGLDLTVEDASSQNLLNYYYLTKSPDKKVKALLDANNITTLNPFADGKKLIHIYAEYGNSKGIGSKALEDEISGMINDTDDFGRTALHYLAQSGDTKTMNLLISSGVDINLADNDGNTPLILAAIASQKVKIAKQIFNKAKPNGKKSVSELIEAGADVTIANNEGKTALHYVVLAADGKAIEALVNAGADKEARDNEGYTPFLLAATNDVAVKSIKTMIKMGGFSYTATNDNGQNIAHIACGSWVEDINAYDKKSIKAVYKPSAVLKDLIKIDENTAIALSSQKDNFGLTPLHYAIKNDNSKAVGDLVKAGVDITLADDNGLSPLGYSYLYSKDYKSVSTLQKAGLTNFADTGDEWFWTNSNKFGKTFIKEGSAGYKSLDTTGSFAIHYAASIGKKGMGDIKKMVEKEGVNVNLQNIHNGMTALHYIALTGDVKSVQTLIEKLGADKDVTDSDGRKALYYAFISGDQDTFEYLLNLE